MNASRSRFPLLAALTLVAGCRASSPDLPAGAGLRAADRTPPEGVETYGPPTWSPGDELRYRRGGRIPLALVVERTGSETVLVDPRGGRELVLDADLARLGERATGAQELSVAFDPLDPAYAWPLWPGKRWTGEYVLRGPGEAPLPVVARYHCDAVEEVTVPAGTFRCLRIWRRDQVDLEGNFVERAAVDWYAPELGHVVRRLEDGLETVLVEALVQAPAAADGTRDDG